MTSRQYTLADVRRAYTAEKQWEDLEGELPVYLIYRPLSLAVTPLFLRLGASALSVTLMSAAVAAALVPAALLGGGGAYLLVAALGFLFLVLDCVDGNVARVRGTASELGRLVDGFVDQLYWGLLVLSLGILVERAGVGVLAPLAVELSLAVAFLHVLNRQTRDNYARSFGGTAFQTPARPAHLSLAWRLRIALGSLDNVYPLAIALGGAMDALGLVLLVVALDRAVLFVVAVATVFAKAAARR